VLCQTFRPCYQKSGCELAKYLTSSVHAPSDNAVSVCLSVCDAVYTLMLCTFWQFLEQDVIISASSTGEVSVYKFDQKQQVCSTAAVERVVLLGRGFQPEEIPPKRELLDFRGWNWDHRLADSAAGMLIF